ncbi:MAG TPA: PhzF family phenazine biosynthesis protein [Dongiaceae bacterium]|nr:PhzF family phenazine biosynthesis protein [Dongiaceae bacterium]
MSLPLYQVDAFTDRAFGGNPAAVMPLKEWLPDATMQAIAAENNLAETAFFVAEGNDYRLRWFTPTIEIDLCGHATLASGEIVLNHLDKRRSEVAFHTRSGKLTVWRDNGRLVMDFPAEKSGPAEDSEIPAVAKAIGADVEALHRGSWAYIAVLKDEDVVRNLKPDIAAIQALPYDVVATARGTKSEIASRVFVPKYGIPEDPVTGKAHCLLMPYWCAVLNRTTLFARQVSPRGGELWLTLTGDRVKMAGHAVLTVTGQFHL